MKTDLVLYLYLISHFPAFNLSVSSSCFNLSKDNKSIKDTIEGTSLCMRQLLYWNEATQKVYSDKFIRIQQPDRIITGHGFDSNQQMTIYTIHNIEGIFYVDEEAGGPPQPETKALPDSVRKDSVK